MEYQCFHLSPGNKLGHEDDAPVLFESDSLGECCNFAYSRFKEESRDIAVYQPRHGAYRDLYRNPARDELGRFVTR